MLDADRLGAHDITVVRPGVFRIQESLRHERFCSLVILTVGQVRCMRAGTEGKRK